MIVGTCRYVNPDISHIYLAEWKNTIIPIYSYKNLISGYEWVDEWFEIKLNTALQLYRNDYNTQMESILIQK